MHRIVISSLSLVSIIVILGHDSRGVSQAPSKREFPVVLYVSSQSSYVDPVNIKVFFEGEKDTVNQDFYYRTGNSHSTFHYSLKKGQHQIIVTSKNGEAGLDVVFYVDKPLWLGLDYWGKNHFQLNISDRPLGFQ